MDTNRLNELKKLIDEKQASMKSSKFAMWCATSPEFAELGKLEAQARVAVRAQHKPVEYPATENQIVYLKSLGVKIAGKQITKSLASQLIDAVKSGDGVGFLGFEMVDGSN